VFSQNFQHHPSCDQCSDVPLDQYTCWIPLHDHDDSHSRLQLLPNSHTLKGYSRAAAGKQQLLPRDAAAQIHSAKLPPQWSAPAAIAAGDVIIYNWRMAYRFAASTHPNQPSCSVSICFKLNYLAGDQIPAPPSSS